MILLTFYYVLEKPQKQNNTYCLKDKITNAVCFDLETLCYCWHHRKKKYIYCLPSCSINLCIRFQWFYSIRLFFLLHTKYKITHTNNFKYKNFLKMGQTFYVKKKNLKCISCMIYNLVDPLHPLIGSYLRDVEEEEKTLMRKRASAPGW